MDARTPPSQQPEALLSKASDPAAVISLLNERLGVPQEEWLAWEPETLWTELKARGLATSDVLKNRIQAVRSLFASGAFWADHLAFEKIAMALNGQIPLFDQYQQPTPGMIAYALQGAKSVRPQKYSDEVLRYIAAICHDAGILVLPEPLDVAQASLDDLSGPHHEPARAEIRQAWLNGPTPDMYTETPKGIQLGRMTAICDYVKGR